MTKPEKESREMEYRSIAYCLILGFILILGAMFSIIIFLDNQIPPYQSSLDVIGRIIIISVIGIALFVFHHLFKDRTDPYSSIKEQFAKGDITYEQYIRMQKEIWNRIRDYLLIRE